MKISMVTAVLGGSVVIGAGAGAWANQMERSTESDIPEAAKPWVQNADTYRSVATQALVDAESAVTDTIIAATSPVCVDAIRSLDRSAYPTTGSCAMTDIEMAEVHAKVELRDQAATDYATVESVLEQVAAVDTDVQGSYLNDVWSPNFSSVLGEFNNEQIPDITIDEQGTGYNFLNATARTSLAVDAMSGALLGLYFLAKREQR